MLHQAEYSPVHEEYCTHLELENLFMYTPYGSMLYCLL